MDSIIPSILPYDLLIAAGIQAVINFPPVAPRILATSSHFIEESAANEVRNVGPLPLQSTLGTIKSLIRNIVRATTPSLDSWATCTIDYAFLDYGINYSSPRFTAALIILNLGIVLYFFSYSVLETVTGVCARILVKTPCYRVRKQNSILRRRLDAAIKELDDIKAVRRKEEEHRYWEQQIRDPFGEDVENTESCVVPIRTVEQSKNDLVSLITSLKSETSSLYSELDKKTEQIRELLATVARLNLENQQLNDEKKLLYQAADRSALDQANNKRDNVKGTNESARIAEVNNQITQKDAQIKFWKQKLEQSETKQVKLQSELSKENFALNEKLAKAEVELERLRRQPRKLALDGEFVGGDSEG